MALWNIVTRQCVPQFENAEALIPPCEHVDIAGGQDRGFVYFKDTSRAWISADIRSGRARVNKSLFRTNGDLNWELG
jgi:hypothetical protein